MKVIANFENKIRKNFGAIIEVNNVDLNKFLETSKIMIGWNVCHVEEHIKVIRCFKCCGYNHRSDVCKNRQSCIRCGAEHKIKDCKAEESRCVNCVNVKRRWNVNFDENHQANSKECPIFKKRVESERKIINYNK